MVTPLSTINNLPEDFVSYRSLEERIPDAHPLRKLLVLVLVLVLVDAILLT